MTMTNTCYIYPFLSILPCTLDTDIQFLRLKDKLPTVPYLGITHHSEFVICINLNFFNVDDPDASEAGTAPIVTATPLPEEGNIYVSWTAYAYDQTSWTVPDQSSGTNIIGYTVEYKDCESDEYTDVSIPGNLEKNTTISGLQFGSTYVVRVAAITEENMEIGSYGSDRVTTYDCTFIVIT